MLCFMIQTTIFADTVSKFLKISSIESKFDEFEPFHKMFVSLKNLDVEEGNIV